MCCCTYRALAYASFYYPSFGRLLNGCGAVLAEQGRIVPEALQKTSVSEKHRREGLRPEGNITQPDQTEIVRLERNGRISVAKKSS